MWILIVDDDVDAADTLAMMLSERGHLTPVVYNGEDALETAADFDPKRSSATPAWPKSTAWKSPLGCAKTRASALPSWPP